MKPEIFRNNDLYVLKGPHFINDSIIEFYFNHLSLINESSADDILLVSPAVTFWVANCNDQESIKECLEPLNLQTKNLVIFAVNNGKGDGGAHWSLLVFYRNMNAFVHHDSVKSINRNNAIALYNAIKNYFGYAYTSFESSDFNYYVPPLISEHKRNKRRKRRVIFQAGGSITTISGGGSGGDGDFPRFVEGKTPQQTNGYDCGLYVMAIAKVICQWYENNAAYAYDDETVDNWFSVVNEEVHKSLELSMRSEVLKIITDSAILV